MSGSEERITVRSYISFIIIIFIIIILNYYLGSQAHLKLEDFLIIPPWYRTKHELCSFYTKKE